jgi:hypothetical protein
MIANILEQNELLHDLLGRHLAMTNAGARLAEDSHLDYRQGRLIRGKLFE